MSADFDVERIVRNNWPRFIEAAATHTRGLSRTDKDDAVQMAMLSMIEGQGAFLPDLDGEPIGSVVKWFTGHVRNAVRDVRKDRIRRGMRAVGEEALENVAANNPTEAIVEAADAIDAMTAGLSDIEREALTSLAEGNSVREVCARTDLQKGAVRRLKKQLNRLDIDQIDNSVLASGCSVTAASDSDSYFGSSKRTRIDEALALEFSSAPRASRKDCPKCHHCAYFEGLQPKGKVRVAGLGFDPEVRQAMVNIAARKVEIAAACEPFSRKARTTLIPVSDKAAA